MAQVLTEKHFICRNSSCSNRCNGNHNTNIRFGSRGDREIYCHGCGVYVICGTYLEVNENIFSKLPAFIGLRCDRDDNQCKMCGLISVNRIYCCRECNNVYCYRCGFE